MRYPGKVIDPPWHVTTVDVKSGEPVSGFLIAQTKDEVTLKIAGGTRTTIAAKDITKTRTERVSVMPEGLLDALTEQQVKDLFAYFMAGAPAAPKK